MSHIILPGNSGFASLRNTSNTKLHIHSDTTDGSTTFADSSGSGHTVNVGAADVAHDTAQKKFGKTSILFDGDSGYLSVDDHADWNMSTGAFTIDFQVRFAALPATTYVFCSQRVDATHTVLFWLAESTGTYVLRFRVFNAGSNEVTVYKTWTTPVVDTWYHIAVIRGWGGNANDFAITVAGTQIGTTVTDTSATWPDLVASFDIGWDGDVNYLAGWMDEFRLVKGEAMWTTQFKPPIGPYT